MITELMSVLSDIESEMDAVSPTTIEALGRKLKPVGKLEKALGTIHNESIKRLFVVHRILGAKRCAQAHEAELATDEMDSHGMTIASAKYDVLEDLVKELLTTQVRVEFEAYRCNIGIRQGWMAVTTPDENSPAHMLQQLFGQQGG